MCESEPEAHVFEGEDFKHSLDFKGGGEAIGVKRLIYDGGKGYQYYYFCEKAKGENKKNCGAWVDKDSKLEMPDARLSVGTRPPPQPKKN
ncbi:unnamed protein product [Caenorhabditis brenneri]